MVDHKDPVLKELLPYDSHFVEIDGMKMHYLDEGSGPVVLLVHGNPTWCFYYRNLISKLKDKFRVIAVDLLGCGLSDKDPNRHFHAKDRIDHLVSFVTQLKLASFSIVMHDWGGAIGTGLSVSMPEKIERIVYLNTTLTETESLPFIIKAASSKLSGKFLTKYTKTFLRFTTGLGTSKKLPKIIKDGYFAPYKTIKDREAIWDFVADIPFTNSHPTYSVMLDLAKKIDRLSQKEVKIIWGLKDPCFHREMLNNVAAYFPQADILEIPEASHLVLEDANSLVCNSIREFLLNGTQTSKEVKYNNPLLENFDKIVDTYPDYTAVIEPLFLVDEVRYGLTTYQNMDLLINKYQRGLVSLGLESGNRVIFLVQPGVDFVALAYAVFKIGAVPVFLDPGMGKDLLLETIEEFKPDAFIGSPKAQLLRILYKKSFASIKFFLVSGEWFFGSPTTRHLKRFSNRRSPIGTGVKEKMIAFTSGATGKPKGVIFTEKNLAAQFNIFKDQFKLEAGKKDLPLLPIFSLFNLALGVTSVFAPLNVAKPLSLDPVKILRLIKDLQINYSFGSPTLWRKISEYCIRTKNKFKSLEKVFMAGAPVSKETLDFVNQTLVNGKSFTPYGSTECLPLTMVSSEEILTNEERSAITGEMGTFVGSALPGIDIKVVEIGEHVTELENLRIGELLVAGDNVSGEYWNNDKANSENKITLEGKLYHRMGDLVYLDGNKIYFCGRAVHRVISENQKYYSIPCEKVFAHKMIRRCALVNLGDKPGLAIEPTQEFWKISNKQEFKSELLDLAKSKSYTNAIQDFFAYEDFPVDGRHNAKIFRDKLSDMAKEGIGKF